MNDQRTQAKTQIAPAEDLFAPLWAGSMQRQHTWASSTSCMHFDICRDQGQSRKAAQTGAHSTSQQSVPSSSGHTHKKNSLFTCQSEITKLSKALKRENEAEKDELLTSVCWCQLPPPVRCTPLTHKNEICGCPHEVDRQQEVFKIQRLHVEWKPKGLMDLG